MAQRTDGREWLLKVSIDGNRIEPVPKGLFTVMVVDGYVVPALTKRKLDTVPPVLVTLRLRAKNLKTNHHDANRDGTKDKRGVGGDGPRRRAQRRGILGPHEPTGVRAHRDLGVSALAPRFYRRRGSVPRGRCKLGAERRLV